MTALADHRNGPAGGFAYVDPASAVRVAETRELPRSTEDARTVMPGFLADLRRRREVNAAMRQHEQDRELRLDAAERPLVKRGPTSGEPPLSPIYLRRDFPRPLPGERGACRRMRWPETPQEREQVLVHHGGDRRPGVTRASDVLLREIGESAVDRRNVGMSIRSDTGTFELLDPSGPLDQEANRWLANDGHTSRGAESMPLAECERRAKVHCAELADHYAGQRPDAPTVTLDALRAPYRPRPGQRDELLDARRAVAVCLRLEGFKTGVIATVLDRDPRKVREWIGVAEEAAGEVEPIYRPVESNYGRKSERASGMQWHEERKAIAREVNGSGPASTDGCWLWLDEHALHGRGIDASFIRQPSSVTSGLDYQIPANRNRPEMAEVGVSTTAVDHSEAGQQHESRG